MILVDAIYTNQSGSKRLLEYFITHSFERGLLSRYFFLLDQRVESEVLTILSKNQYLFLKPGESERRKYYRKIPSEISCIFCFGSVPPPVKIKDRNVLILQHNPFFFENPGFSLGFKTLYLIKRLYIWSRCYKTYNWVVQTQRIKDILIRALGVRSEKIAVKPFFEPGFFDDTQPASVGFPLKFIYPADGVPQKNHNYLFNVWERLYSQYNLLPELHVTIPAQYTHHIQTIQRLKDSGLQIFNHGFVSKSEIKSLYKNSHFLVFPSMSESFGLPLAEAANAGLKVIGSDLPYLFQVIEPSATFNPKDPKSLLKIIVSLHNGEELKPTKVLIRNHLPELIEILFADEVEVNPKNT